MDLGDVESTEKLKKVVWYKERAQKPRWPPIPTKKTFIIPYQLVRNF